LVADEAAVPIASVVIRTAAYAQPSGASFL
jgi:hypothetical protein